MIIKYIDTQVVLCASTKYSPYKTRASRIIGGFGETYALKIPTSLFNRILKIYDRRNENYRHLYSKLNASNCIGKKPVDFRGCFTRGSTGDYIDQEHLIEMYDKITMDLNINDLEKLTEDNARLFCDKAFDIMGYNKRHLGFIIDMIKEGELIFENENKTKEKKLFKEFKKEFDDPRFKYDLNIFAECITDGINSHMDFEMIIYSQHFLKTKELRKIYTAIKRVYKQDYRDLIVSLKTAYG